MSVPVSVGWDYHRSSVQVRVLAEVGTVLGHHARPNGRREIARYVRRFGGAKAAAAPANRWVRGPGHPGLSAAMVRSATAGAVADARL